MMVGRARQCLLRSCFGRGYEPGPAPRHSARRLRALPAFAPPALPAQRQVGVLPADAAFAQQHGDIGGDIAKSPFAGAHQHMREARAERQFRQRLAMGGDAAILIQRVEQCQALARFRHRRRGRRVEPAQRRRIAGAPERAIQ